MHTNYRRKNIHRAKHHNDRCWPLATSLAYYKAESSRRRRAQQRDLMVHERFDDLPNRRPKDIYWFYY